MKRITVIIVFLVLFIVLGVSRSANSGAATSAAGAILATGLVPDLPDDVAAKLNSSARFIESSRVADDVVERSISLRHALGLDASPERSRAIEEGTIAGGGIAISTSYFSGLGVSVEEAAKLIDRAFLQWKSFELNALLAKSVDGFIESRIRYDLGEERFVIDVLLERESQEFGYVKDLVFDGDYRSRVSATFVRRPVAAIRRDGHLAAELIEKSGIPGAAYWLDYWTGTVGISASTSDALQSFYSALTSVGVQPGEMSVSGNNPSTWKSQAQIYNSVFAGLKVSGPSGDCTTGFGVGTAYGNMLLTAGHCFSLNAPTVQGGSALGPVVARNYRIYYCCDEGTFDAAIIASGSTLRPTFGRIHLNDADWAHQITGWIGMNSDSVGAIVCHSGITTAGLSGYDNPSEHCGPITQRSYSPSGYMYQPRPVYRISTAQSRGGDSGGAFYWNSIYGSLGVGLMSGRTCGGVDCVGNSILSHLPYILEHWGVTPLTN